VYFEKDLTFSLFPI